MRRGWWLAVGLAACSGGSPQVPSPDAAPLPDAAPPVEIDAGACAPLDEATLASLTHNFSLVPVVEALPGADIDLDLGTVECCYLFTPAATCATWSVSPAEGARIEPTTGVLHIDEGTPSGAAFTVTADVEVGRKLITAEVAVYTREAMPWQGYWHEDVEYDCSTGTPVTPQSAINEIYFWANGHFWVTWFPFEIYVDYWGSHHFEAGAVELTVEGGNYIPPDVDGSGGYSFDESGRLVLSDLWLGVPSGGSGARCGHRLAR